MRAFLVYAHFGEKVDDQHAGDDQNHAEDGWQVGNLFEPQGTDDGDEHDAQCGPDAVCHADGVASCCWWSWGAQWP